MGIQDLVRLVLPKEERFFEYLEQQAKLANEGARVLATLAGAANGGTFAEIKDRVHEIEKRGDKVSHELEDALAETFVTPIDREDIHKLSSLLDDILDGAYACASAFVMFCIDKPSPASIELFAILERATAVLVEIVPALRKHQFDEIREGRRTLKGIEKEGDEVYRRSMRALFSEPGIDARSLIREKEVIEILENAVDTCEDAAEYLANLAVKHG